MFTRKKKNPERQKGRKSKPGREELVRQYVDGGCIPWSKGYREYKMQLIERTVNDPDVAASISRGDVPAEFGRGVDERCVEYPWAMSRLSTGDGPVLDAGSALNFPELAQHELWKVRPLTIAGLSVEKKCFYDLGISYQFCDLRELPFRSDWFASVACLSTLEHIGMDNSIYGHDDEIDGREVDREYRPDPAEFLQAVREICRVTRPGGDVFITVPVGRFEFHGFFQQFDDTLIDLLCEELSSAGVVERQFFRYQEEGWVGCEWEDCSGAQSHNPNTGVGKGTDGAAHCRAVGCFSTRIHT